MRIAAITILILGIALLASAQSPAPTMTPTPTAVEVKAQLQNESAAIDAEVERLQGIIDEALKQIGGLALRKKALESAIIKIRVPERKTK